ncbi:MAG TPA: tripartite tricarboxylate transporter substrate binding protein [Burkholderiales bacterium]|nr:tripartite tricarboxylate transporter substrate binding protein [Burkholderiales bacterium]
MSLRALVQIGLLGIGAAACVTAYAQAWPAKPVRIIVPFGPGGGTDIQGRLLGKKFYESMGQTFVVDNRAGASGLIGAELVAKSPPDGYTILFTTASLSVNVSLFKKIPLDPLKELQPVSWISSVPLVLILHPSVPAKSVRELVALTKKQKNGLNAASNGAGTTSHLSLEMLKQFAGANLTHIPYKGGGPAMTAMLGGEVDFQFATALAAQPHVKSGKVKALAVTTLKKSSAFPDLPTMASIYPGFESDNWYAMFLPAGTPREIVTKLNAEIVKGVKAPDVREFITKEGGDPVGSSPEELAKYFRQEIDKYAKIIKAGNITAE